MKREDIASSEASGINLVKWMDCKPVYMLSNFLSAYPLHDIKRRQKGQKEQEKLFCPNVVKQYNNIMGRVDLMDQKKPTISLTIDQNLNITSELFLM